jgi:hypothetical protein
VIIVPADEFENEADLIRRVESLLEKTKEKKKTDFKTDDTVKTIIKYVNDVKTTNVNKTDQSSLKTKIHLRKHLLNDLKIEVSTPGNRKIINMSEHGDGALNTDKKDIHDNKESIERPGENISTSIDPESSAVVETLCSERDTENKR